MADSPEHESADTTHDAESDSAGLTDVWSEFAPSVPALIYKSRQMVAAASQLGECIGDFEIRGLLGEGAFGKVLLARQISLDREIALKVTANLGHEGRTMARLEHSYIVQVFSETVHQDLDLRLLCMQYVPGATLGQIIQRLQKRTRDQRDGAAILEIIDELSPRPATLDPSSLRDRELLHACTSEEAACRIAQQLAEALAYAHGRNVLHRDIKPANVIVNQYGQPMLTDFSLSFPTTGIANIGVAVFGGTLGYMAPEHLDALNPNHSAGPDVVRERSDIYSLGAVLLDLLTGMPRIRTDENSLDGRDLDRITAGYRDITQVVELLHSSGVPAPLARIIRRCLAPDPDDRYPTAQHLAESLAGCFQLIRTQRKLPAGGLLTRWAVARPLTFIMTLTVVPNVLASATNIVYNSFVVIRDLTPHQQSAFLTMVAWYNVVVVVILALWVDRTLIAVARQWRTLAREPEQIAIDFELARQRTLRLPFWTVVLGSVGWLPFSVVIPLGMETLAGPVDQGVMIHISIAFMVTGLIGISYNYFVVSFTVLRAMYTRLWNDAYQFHQRAAQELAGVPRFNRACQVLAGLTPLGAAALLVVVGPEQFDAASYDRFRGVVVVLIGLGVLGFWIATLSTALTNELITTLTAPREVRSAK